MAGREVSKLYAGALFEIGVQNNNLPQIEEELGFLTKLLSEEKDLMFFLNAPVVSKEKKKELIERLFSNKFSLDMICFINVLIDNDRQSAVPFIFRDLVSLIDQKNNRQRIKVISSVKLDANVLKQIESSIGNHLKKSIIIEEEIDEFILGGVIIKIDDLLIDGSLAKDLNLMRAKLIETKVGSGIVYED